MNKLHVNIFRWPLGIFTTQNIQQSVYGYFIHFILIWISPLLLTINCHLLRPVQYVQLTNKCKLTFKKKYLKPWQPFIIGIDF